jgi:hypothetical protein
MSRRRHALLLLAALAFGTLLAGCATDPANNDLPWDHLDNNQPGIPGLGNVTGGGNGVR